MKSGYIKHIADIGGILLFNLEAFFIDIKQCDVQYDMFHVFVPVLLTILKSTVSPQIKNRSDCFTTSRNAVWVSWILMFFLMAHKDSYSYNISPNSPRPQKALTCRQTPCYHQRDATK